MEGAEEQQRPGRELPVPWTRRGCQGWAGAQWVQGEARCGGRCASELLLVQVSFGVQSPRHSSAEEGEQQQRGIAWECRGNRHSTQSLQTLLISISGSTTRADGDDLL